MSARVVEVVSFQVECASCGWEHSDWMEWRNEDEWIAQGHTCPPEVRS